MLVRKPEPAAMSPAEACERKRSVPLVLYWLAVFAPKENPLVPAPELRRSLNIRSATVRGWSEIILRAPTPLDMPNVDASTSFDTLCTPGATALTAVAVGPDWPADDAAKYWSVTAAVAVPALTICRSLMKGVPVTPTTCAATGRSY